MKVVAQPEDAPRAVGGEADAQRIDDDLAAAVAEFVRGAAVDLIDREMPPPLVSPFRPMEPLDHEDQLLDVGWDRTQPVVVGVGVVGR